MENKNNQGDENSSNNSDDNQIVQKIIDGLEKLWMNVKATIVEILQRIGAYDLYNRIVRFSTEHPYWAITAAITLAAFMLPFAIIILLALSTVVLTFSGFAIIEGTLIAFISIFLFGCLGALVLASLFFGAVSVTGYFGLVHATNLYQSLTNYSTKLTHRQPIEESEKK